MSEVQLRKGHLFNLNKLLSEARNHKVGKAVLDHYGAQELLNRAEEIFAKYEQVQQIIIENSVGSDAEATQFEEGYKVETVYHQLRKTLREIIDTTTPATATAAAAASAVTSVSIKLPPMPLPEFDGKIEDWTSFKDLFLSTVGNNNKLGGAEKLRYLKAALRGDAAALIRSLVTTDVNYPVAWKLLMDKYENEREVVFALINKLYSAKPLKEESATNLESLVELFAETTRALEVLKRPVGTWDDILVFWLTKKLDGNSRREWAMRLTGTGVPTFMELTGFLKTHIRGLKAVGSGGQQVGENRRDRNVKSHTASSSAVCCVFCGDNHPQFRCTEFKKKPVGERRNLVRKWNLCFNCLGKHMVKNCKWRSTCNECNGKHNTLLHGSLEKGPSAAEPAAQAQGRNVGEKSEEATVNSHHAQADPQVVLKTAVVKIMDKFGQWQLCRCLIDGGSEADMITSDMMTKLGLRRNKSNIRVTGAGGASAGPNRGTVQTTVVSRLDGDKGITTKFHILDKITGALPGSRVQGNNWVHLDGLELADPNWSKPAKVDVLLGGRHYHKILLKGRRQVMNDHAPVAWESIFGWLISGVTPEENSRDVNSFCVTYDKTDEILQRFWELEELPQHKELSKEEAACEQYFVDTHRRDADGRFIVSIPFNERKGQLGGTRRAAVQRFYQVERRMQRNTDFREKYVNFMREYELLGHMQKVPEEEDKEVVGQTAHLPHHGVLNLSSTTTKLRTVFDGSAQSTTGVSLNETMMVGATVQSELYDILLRFRLNEVVIKADISKMFRQFHLSEEDSNFHRIVWRENTNLPLSDYKLRTVTYGTACAPFLATRCLHQLALDCAEKYPAASEVLLNSTYVDDVLTSCQTPEEGKELFSQLSAAVASAKMELRKWTTNNSEVLTVIPEDQRDSGPLAFEDDSTVKALGVQWHPTEDVFRFNAVEFKHDDDFTKRKLLSDAARVFDPLGLISAFSVRAKMMLQELWKLQCGWDEIVPDHVKQKWNEYRDEIKEIASLSIPRQIIITKEYEVHGFSDSSEKALGAIVYIRSYNSDGTISVSFVTSKTKVAPVKLVTLPRLELEAAVMLAKLVRRVIKTLDLNGKVILWTDSTITLKWIQGSPNRWKTFVGNRVSKIQKLTEVDSWRHVPGVDNPADLASRGVSSTELINSNFWWKGPAWLKESTIPTFTAPEKHLEIELEERASVVKSLAVSLEKGIVERFSSLTRLKRVTVYLFRVLKGKTFRGGCRDSPTPGELEMSLQFWIREVQREAFPLEFAALEKGGEIKHSSKLKALNPYLDNNGILRISGRLSRAELPETRKHQIILPSRCHIAQLVIKEIHEERTLHGGFQLTFSRIQSEYWIIRGRDEVRHFIRKCVRCRRYGAAVASQLMGSLPSVRVTPARPFLHTGVDYAGPFTLKNPIGRVPKTYKGYMCLFVCMATKAVHLEAVSSLSTDGFLEAFQRFTSRRGLCAHVFSDCGTNFVGADKELRSLLRNPATDRAIEENLSSRNIQWHFNPPSAPHHGGLWEAGVKSAKHHLRRVIGNTVLTYEKFTTILCQIEAVLNSRPLYAMSADPADLEALSPGHFLVGEPLVAVPVANLEEIKGNRLNQYQLQQQRVQHFWRRWSAEYLNTLQQRNKWRWTSNNVQMGDLVLIVEETSPGNWRMGRVVELHPGDDGLVRVVTVRTATGEIKRPIAKLIPLINNDN